MLLLGRLWDSVEQLVRTTRRMGQLRGSVDDRREVVSRVFARLRSHDLRALRTFPRWSERHGNKTFDDWLTIVVTNVIRDYVRERLGGTDETGAALKRLVNTLADSLDEDTAHAGRMPVTARLTATALLERAKQILTHEQLDVLGTWLEGADFAQVATRHALPDRETARALVRAALAKLRRDLREDES